MSFGHPWVLLALVVPAALIAWEVLRRDSGRAVPVPVDHARPRQRRWLEGVLRAAGLLPPLVLAAAVILLAGPRRLGPPGEERALTNIEILLDVSGSMASPIGYGRAGASRYTAAMDSINTFTGRRKGDALGLTIFGGEVVRWVPLTKDLSAIRNATPFLDPATMPAPLQSTRVGHALLYAQNLLARQEEGDRLVILVTDGFSSDLGGSESARIGGLLRDDRIVVYGVNVGDGAPPNDMIEVVAPTGGRVYSAADQPSLNEVFAHIDKMNPVKVKPTQPEPIDHFWPFTTAALALLGAHGLCLFGLRWTPW